MKIVFFGNDTEKIAAIRYRIKTFAEMLEADGHTCIICLPSSVALKESLYENSGKFSKLLYLLLVFLNRLLQLRHTPTADVVFFRGPLLPYGPPFLERLIRFFNPRMLFDIDDAIWEPPAHVTSPFLRFVDFGWVRKMSRICAHAVVGNEHLAAYVRQENPNVSIVPTCIDMQRHKQKKYPKGDTPVTLGWTGLKDNLGYMEIIESVLQELAEKYALQLSVATGRPYTLEGVEVKNHYWTLEHEIDYLSDADIGLMPLKETPRAKGKCAFKALQYMAVGTPAIISPVGMNADVIDDGVNGFLARTPEEWKDKLEQLIQDADLRERMGRAARETVQRHYSHDANYPIFKQVMEQVAAQKTSK